MLVVLEIGIGGVVVVVGVKECVGDTGVHRTVVTVGAGVGAAAAADAGSRKPCPPVHLGCGLGAEWSL